MPSYECTFIRIHLTCGVIAIKSQEFAKLLHQSIERGEYRETGKLPTEEELIASYGVTRYCVRGAVGQLVSLGELYPVQGSGMYVRESKREGCLSISGTPGLTADLGEDRLRTEAKSIELVGATGDLAKRMKCAEGTEVYQLLRLRYVDERPFDLEYSWYLKSIVRYLNREIAEGSIYRYLREDVGIAIAFSDKILRTEKLDASDAKLLELPEGDPALIVEDDAYTSNGQLFNASRNLYDWRRAKFFTLSQTK